MFRNILSFFWHIMLPTKSFAWVWTFNVKVRDNLKKELQLLLPLQKSTSCWIPNWGLHLAQPCKCQGPSGILHLHPSPSDDSTARIVWEWPSMKKSCLVYITQNGSRSQVLRNAALCHHCAMWWRHEKNSKCLAILCSVIMHEPERSPPIMDFRQGRAIEIMYELNWICGYSVEAHDL